MNPARRSFGSKEDLAIALAEAVADNLKNGLESRGVAALAVSGGTTPARFFGALGRHADLDWGKVYVTHVDVWDAVDHLVAVMAGEEHLRPEYAVRNAVT